MGKNFKKVVVITGSSSGIGFATAIKFSRQGHLVYGLSKNKAESEEFTSLICDVTNSAEVGECLKQIFKQEGRIDIFINNAGMGVSGAVEFVEKESSQKQVDLNLVAYVDCAKQVVPYIKQSGGGKIFFTSSVASFIPIPFQAVYSATKAGVNAFSMALGIELAPFNIKVAAVLPGDTKTSFTSSRIKNTQQEGYNNRVENSVKKMERDEKKGHSPEKVANVFYKLSKKKNPKPITCVGFNYKLIAFLNKILPTRLMLFIVKKMYG